MSGWPFLHALWTGFRATFESFAFWVTEPAENRDEVGEEGGSRESGEVIWTLQLASGDVTDDTGRVGRAF